MKLSPRYLALCAFFVAALTLAACGGSSIPGNAVVKVGDTSITRADFDHWLRVAAISSQGQTNPAVAAGTKKASIPDPPDFKACVAAKRTSTPTPAKGQPAQTDAQLKQQCQTEYAGLRDQVLQFLISAQWIMGESKDQGVQLSDAEVAKQFATTKKQSFPTEAAFQKFLKGSGMTLDDLKFRVRVQALSDKLRTKVTKGTTTVTPAQISRYYAKNKARFAQPERRDLRIVLTKKRSTAKQALAALRGGAFFTAVAKKYSIDPASKNQGGSLRAVAKGQQEKALDDAVFKAPKGKLEGPIKTQFGYYVFKVEKITPASQQTLLQATPTIKSLLSSQNQQTALNNFVKDFQKRWKDMTDCRKGFVTQNCSNAPKQKTPTATTGAPVTPQQGAPPAGQGGSTTPGG